MEREHSDDSRSTTYRITPQGLERLRQLLAEPPQGSKPRNGLLLRLFFGAQLGPEKCADLVLSAREAAEQRLVELGAARAELLEDTRLVADAPYVLLTIAAGEHSARAAITWADEALRELAKLARGE